MQPNRVTKAPAPRRKRRNRRKAGPLRSRIPDRAAIARGLRRGLRAALPYLAVAGGVAAVGTGGWLGYRWLLTSDRFALEAIEIRGNERAGEARILARLPAAEGDNIFRVDLGTATGEVERDPWVARAEVSRRLPDRLVVEVTEHEPAALVELDGLYLADAEGTVFKRADLAAGDADGVGRTLPIVTGIARDEYLADPAATAAHIREALAALAAYRSGSERPAVGEVRLDPRRGVLLVTTEHAITIRLGRGQPETLATRLEVFDAAWDALEPEERASARVIYADNVTRPDRITVAFAEQVDN